MDQWPLSAIVPLIVPFIGLVSALIATYVSLQSRAVMAEVRRELAELENRIILRLNGTYVRRDECELRRALVERRVELSDSHKHPPPASGAGGGCML